jgi:uncharacterized coiled-coil protein SlyX
MAGKNEIKTNIRLAGEKEYSKAIDEASRHLKALKSELKAETAELGKNATAQQKNEARAKSLKAQIAEQEKVVETLKKALAEAKRDYGDNEEVVQHWEQQLNEARATLAYMKSDLSDAGNAMRGASSATAEGVTATKSFADALGSIASAGESVSGAIEGIFSGMISGVRDALVELWELIGDTAAKANNWTDIAGYWNTDPVNVEKWANAVKDSGNNFADLEAIVTRLNLGGKNKEIAELLGVSEANYGNQWDYAMAVMDRISELSKSGNLPENLWETIFGEKKSTKVKDLVNDWDTIKEGLTTYDADNGGFGMDSEELQTMNDLYVQITGIETKWDALKDKMAAGFGKITADLLVNVSGSLDALNDFMNADSEGEREAALKKLRENVEEFFKKVAEAIRVALEQLSKVGEELSQSDDPLVAAIGNLLTKLTDAFQWMIDNQDAVKIALEVIFGIWLSGKLAGVAGQLTSIVADIETVKNFKDWKMPTTAPAGNAAEVGGSAAASGGGFLAGLKNLPMSLGMAGGAGTVAPIAALIAGGYAGMKLIQANMNDEQLNAVYGHENGEGGMLDTMSQESWQRAFEYYRIFSDQDMTGTEAAFDARDSLFESLESDGIDLSEQAVSLLENAFENRLNETDPDGMIAAIEQRYPKFFEEDATWTDAAATVTDSIDRLVGTNQTGTQPGMSGEDVGFFKGLPGLMRQALLGRISGIKVVMDSVAVGHLVAPTVSQDIAQSAQ